MSEPTNPLFENEKAFLERKKQEYERALRGDVAQLKKQTADVGRIALVSTGLVGSIWLITKAFSRKKRSRQADYPAGYEPFGHRSQHFGDFDLDEEGHEPAYGTDRWAETDSYFGGADADHGTVYHSESNSYDSPGAANEEPDDNGLGAYPDFPAHSGHAHGAATGHFESEAYGHPESTLPFDDSRRLPESEEFTEARHDHIDQYPGRTLPVPPSKPADNLGAMLFSLAKSSVGKVIMGQAVSLVIALASKAIKDRLPSDTPETPKNSDLADLTGKNDGYAHGHPATPHPDAHHAPAAPSA